jgi:hypothetical protein
VIDCVANEHHQVTRLPFLADAHDPDGFPNPTIFFFFSFYTPTLYRKEHHEAYVGYSLTAELRIRGPVHSRIHWDPVFEI